MIYLLYLLALLAFPFALRWFIRRLRKGKIVDRGTIQISKDPESNTFKCVVRINGNEFDGILDTGASITTIGMDTAERIGIDISSLYFDTHIDTAAGTKYAAMAEINVDTFQIGPIIIENMGIGVNRFGERQCLVGMNFFESLDSFQIKGDVLTLRKGHDQNSFDGPANQSRTRKAAPTATSRILAECPHCATSMTLPAGKEGNVRCRSCNKLFFADTSSTIDGKANSRPVQ